MDPIETKDIKCAHEHCLCKVSGEQRYCSAYCEAAATDVAAAPGRCECGHDDCAV